ncbi:MAG: hypothetical protein E6Q88_12200 [Lysobacteraceae bacterium]|nr:MAG: hypothetical protein E6Q88_12200 [Xanthomonadaceae bacterium]
MPSLPTTPESESSSSLASQASTSVAQVLVLPSPDPPPMLAGQVDATRAWTGVRLDPARWRVALPEDVVAELRRDADMLDAHAPIAEMPAPSAAEAPACVAFAKALRRSVERAPGFVLISGLPLQEWGDEIAIRAFWRLGRLLSRPVATKWDGTMLYDVVDTGKRFGAGVRGSATNVELSFHTDNAFGPALPDFVGLLCVRPALSGGVSRVCSLYTVHEALRRRDPRLLQRLYRPAYYDRQAEHAADAPPTMRAPLFAYDGEKLSARLTPNLIRRGYAQIGEPMDAALAEAMEALEEVLADPALSGEFAMRAGDMQFLNNHWIAHYRSAFQDMPEKGDDLARGRRVIRVWYRDCGSPAYDG